MKFALAWLTGLILAAGFDHWNDDHLTGWDILAVISGLVTISCAIAMTEIENDQAKNVSTVAAALLELKKAEKKEPKQ